VHGSAAFLPRADTIIRVSDYLPLHSRLTIPSVRRATQETHRFVRFCFKLQGGMIDAELMGKNFPYSFRQFVHLAEHLVIRNNMGRQGNTF